MTKALLHLNWNEAVYHIFLDESQRQSVPHGRRTKERSELAAMFNILRHAAKDDATFYDELDDAYHHELREFLFRLALLSRPPGDKSVDQLCAKAREILRRWTDEDRLYSLAQSVLMQAARNGDVRIISSIQRSHRSKTKDVPSAWLGARLTIDVDRRHLVPFEGQLFGQMPTTNIETSVFFNVRVVVERSVFKGLRREFKRRKSQQPSRPALIINKEVLAWARGYVEHFERSGAYPSATQLECALLINWPDATQHQRVARQLAAELKFRPQGAPRER